MSIDKHRERIIEAVNTAFDRIEEINELLVKLEDAIKFTQPKKTGAVTLFLNKCGSDCAGCPHPKWAKWGNKKSRTAGKGDMWVMSRISNPMQSLKKTGEFAKYHQETKDLVQGSLDLINERAKLLAAIGSVGRSLGRQANKIEEKNRS